MERFSFRPKSVLEVAVAIGKPSTDITLTRHPDGQVDVATPDLTVAQRTALRDLLAALGLMEVV